MRELLVVPQEFAELKSANILCYDEDVMISACRLYATLREALVSDSRESVPDKVVIGCLARAVTNVDSCQDAYWVNPCELLCGEDVISIESDDLLRTRCVSTFFGGNTKEQLIAMLSDKRLARQRVIYNPFAFHAARVCEELEFDYEFRMLVVGNIATGVRYDTSACKFSDIVKL